MEIFEIKRPDEQLTVKEKIEDLVAKLQMLKSKVSELRLQCENIKKLYSSEGGCDALLCDECGKTIERGQEVIVKDSSGMERRHYHKECFKALWL
jgi:prefoldin subunit 5